MLEGLVAGEGDVVEAETEVRAAPRQALPHQRDVLDGTLTEWKDFSSEIFQAQHDRAAWQVARLHNLHQAIFLTVHFCISGQIVCLTT